MARANDGTCISPVELAGGSGAAAVERRYRAGGEPIPQLGRTAAGEKIMRKKVLACIALAIALTGSPLAAQQSVPSEPPPASELPPPVPQRATELPPPFPHYPARAPREHDPNYRKSTHAKRSASTHQAKSHHRSTTHHKAKTHHASRTHHKGKTKHHASRMYFSKKTIRQCHAMSYRQIMAHKYCRVMMEQDLDKAGKPKRRASTHHRSTRHHKARHRR
jgi:hypothetical protein